MAPGSLTILGIETSCDETAVAIYDSMRGLLAHEVYSQIGTHAPFGGVVPELASRDHIRKLLPLLEQAMATAGAGPADLSGVAYTAGPGLIGALLVGAGVASGLALARGVPAIPVPHMEAHLLAPLLESDAPDFPFVALLVSGGHSMLVDVTAVGSYRVLGQTLDDAAGEAFDKTAKLLGLPYPGGPQLARLADTGRPDRFDLPRPMLRSASLDFSFSGLKTAVALASRELGGADMAAADRADLASGFQAAVVDTLIAKCLRALEQTGRTRLIVAGGVGANRSLRERLAAELSKRGARAYYPRHNFCTDNAAMVALTGALRFADALPGVPAVSARARWSLDDLAPPGTQRI